MRPSPSALLSAALLSCVAAHASEPFTGRWQIDLRSRAEMRQQRECGTAEFDLTQSRDQVSGRHSMASVGCGRINEGGAVMGVVVGDTAVLVVTSGRNGAIVLGKAKLVGGKLAWQTIEEVRRGEPEGDSDLILGSGLLTRQAR